MANPNDPFTSPGPAPKSGGGGSGWLIALVVIILAIVAYYVFGRSGEHPSAPAEPPAASTPAPAPAPAEPMKPAEPAPHLRQNPRRLPHQPRRLLQNQRPHRLLHQPRRPHRPTDQAPEFNDERPAAERAVLFLGQDTRKAPLETRSGESAGVVFENRRAADIWVREHRKRRKPRQMAAGVEFMKGP
ncbi:hypothetical protein AJ88_00125 [Mesorhizobium amorphae CCBAU 01583]|nr:hypothetical protein AJ88_00125 [Mesorhizobium amorphae CCBAU 01583]